jgi:hypothetical protein
MTRFPKWFRYLAALVPAAMAWSILTSAAPAPAGQDSGGGDAPSMTLFATGPNLAKFSWVIVSFGGMAWRRTNP